MKKIFFSWPLFFLPLTLLANVEIEKREIHLKHFSCLKCHENIKSDGPHFPLKTPHHLMKFEHHENIKSCYLCHDKDNINFLRLQTSEKISFDQSYRVCAQCHGEKKRDWEAGIHGKQIGSWSGDKYKFSCTHCHDPHFPKPEQMKADPGPKHPNALKGGH